VGSLGVRVVNETQYVTLSYVCNGVIVGNLTTRCFLEDRLLIKNNCSVSLHAHELTEVRYLSIMSRIRYAPDPAMQWGDCSQATHLQTRKPLCMVDTHFEQHEFCEVAGLPAPETSRSCCTSFENLYDSFFNSDYVKVTMFFDLCGLLAGLARITFTHLALSHINNWPVSGIFIVWLWLVPFIGGFIKYSWPLGTFVSEMGQKRGMALLNEAVSSEYNMDQIQAQMRDVVAHAGAYEPLVLYMVNLLDQIRAYMIYAQAMTLVGIEFSYRTLYGAAALGELLSVCVGVLPGFRSGSIVLKTLLPESVTLGWVVSFGPLLYLPFMAAGTLCFVQLFTDYWFTIGASIYSLSNLVHIIFFWRVAEHFTDSKSFRQLTRKQDRIRTGLLLIASIFFSVFCYFATTKGDHSMSSTMKSVGLGGMFSLAIRIMYNLQICSLFTADALLFVLRKMKNESSRDLMAKMDFDKALDEFTIMVTPKLATNEMALVRGGALDLSTSTAFAVMNPYYRDGSFKKEASFSKK